VLKWIQEIRRSEIKIRKENKTVPNKKQITRKIARKSGNGRITTLEYAKKHPTTTVVETVKIVRKRK